MTAIGVINGLQHQGFRVPEDFSVVGFDDLRIAEAYSPALTTVRQPTDRLGKFAVDLLHNLAAGSSEISPTIIKPELIIRQSTASIC
jgi:DNA-binding LacI/PurR family transcriptional regulator